MEEERKPYGGFQQFMEQEGCAAMHEWNRQRIQAAETELKEFMAKFQKYENSNDPQAKTYYEMGIKMRQDDIDIMKKFFEKYGR